MQPGDSAFFPSFWQDVRFGARILWRSPAMTLVILFALALGIGANSAMFSVVDALLLHPLSYDAPDDLDLVFDRDQQGQLRSTSAGNFLDWRKAKSYSGLAAWAPSVYVLGGLDRPVQVPGGRVTANIFDVLQVKPFLGRTFLVGEDGLDGSATVSRVVVISYGLWRDALGSDPNVLGRTLRLNDTPYAVIGVMQPDFELFDRRAQVWVPAVLNAANRDYRYLSVVGRRTVSRPEAAAEMRTLSQNLSEAFPASNRGWTAQVEGLQDWLVNRLVRTRLLLLFAAVGLVLLLACSNVASLLMARSLSRNREIALRVSLGATRGRIVRQMLIESLTLSLLGGVAGLGLAAALIRVAPAYIPASAIPTTAPIQLSFDVIAFTAAISLLTGLLFGMAPALAASRPDVQEVLQDTSRGATGSRARQSFRQAMVILEVAAALALLSAAVVMSRSMQRLASLDLGVNTHNVLTQRIFLPVANYDAEKSLRYHRQVLLRASQLPGVTEVAMGSNLPLARLGMEIGFDLESAPIRAMADMNPAGYTTATPGYFHLLGVPLIEGREFEDTDAETSPAVVVINSTFTKRYFPNGGAVGQRLRMVKPLLGTNDFGGIEYVQIVGVVADVTLDEIGGDPVAMVYAPMAQNVWSTAHWLAVRTSGNPTQIAQQLRQTIIDLDGTLPLDPATSLEASVESQFAEPLFQSRLMTAFAGLALVLAVVGIYSINAYAVSQRRREIGVRLALGAPPGLILIDLLASGMRLTMVGVAVGIGAAYGLNKLLSSALEDVGALDIINTLTAAFVLTVVAGIACLLPAWRATHIDPAATLRSE